MAMTREERMRMRMGNISASESANFINDIASKDGESDVATNSTIQSNEAVAALVAEESREESSPVEKIQDELNQPETASNTVASDDMVCIQISLPAEVDDYLVYRARELSTPIKSFLSDILLNELKNTGFANDELAVEYRKIQHANTKRSVLINQSLKTAVQKAAAKNRMKFGAYIRYAVHKAKNNDCEYID